MKIHSPHVAMLRQALITEHRQLTLAEQLMAKDIFDSVRRDALAAFGEKWPDMTVLPSDDPLTASLKKRSLYEVAHFVDEGHATLPDDLREVLMALLPEALADYAAHGNHRVARPTAVNVLASNASNAASQNAQGPSTDVVLAARVDSLSHALADLDKRTETVAETMMDMMAMLRQMRDAAPAPSSSSSSAPAPAPAPAPAANNAPSADTAKKEG